MFNPSPFFTPLDRENATMVADQLDALLDGRTYRFDTQNLDRDRSFDTRENQYMDPDAPIAIFYHKDGKNVQVMVCDSHGQWALSTVNDALFSFEPGRLTVHQFNGMRERLLWIITVENQS